MSNDATRAALAVALSTVSGVTGYPRRPKVFKPGDAWPQWAGSERTDGRSFLESWNILVVLPADEPSADVFADTRQAALLAALSPVVFVDSFAPANIQAEGDVLGLLITGRSE